MKAFTAGGAAIVLLFLSVSLASVSIQAKTIEDLLAEGSLSVEARVNSAESTVKSPVVVSIEFATKRWFAKGSRLSGFSLPNTVIPPISELAINGSLRVGGETWVTQTREIVIFPTRPGLYTVPVIEAQVSVNTNEGVVEGVVRTTPLEFSVLLPEPLSVLDDFFVSSDAEVSIDVTGEKPEGEVYRIGDSVTLEVEVMATGIPAMMIPDWNFPDISGANVYRKPTQREDKSDRGETTGISRTEVSYIFEEGGDYRLPEQRIAWWNSETEELDELVVPEFEWNVSGSRSLSRSLPKLDGLIPNITFAIGLLVALYLIARLWRLMPHIDVLKSLKLKAARKKRQQQFEAAVRQARYVEATDLLYHIHDLPHGDEHTLRSHFKPDTSATELLEQLVALAYGESARGVNPHRLYKLANIRVTANSREHEEFPVALNE